MVLEVDEAYRALVSGKYSVVCTDVSGRILVSGTSTAEKY